MYLHAYGKSGLEIATNTVLFVTELFPFVIEIYGGVTNLRPAFTVEIKLKGFSSWHIAATFSKMNKAMKYYFVSRHEFCLNF